MKSARPVIFHRKGDIKSERALEYLQSRDIGHELVEVKEDEGSLRRLEKATGQTKTPALIYKNENLHDFGLPDLAAFLNKYQLDSRPGG